MKAIIASICLIALCANAEPPPFLFTGATSVKADGNEWLVRSSMGLSKRSCALGHAITFDGLKWRFVANPDRWLCSNGDAWQFSGSTWRLDARAELSFSGTSAVLIASGVRYDWRFDGLRWSLVGTRRVVPEGLQASGTTLDMASRRLANLRRQPRTKSNWKNVRH